MAIAIVPGGVTRGELRALVIVRGPAVPGPGVVPRVTIAPSPPNAVVTVTRRSGGADVDNLLRRQGVAAFRIEVSGLGADVEHAITAALDGQSARIRMRTLPARLPAEGMTLAIASCCYHGFPLQERLRVALEARPLHLRPRLGLFVGDNVYLDVSEDARAPEGRAEEVVGRYLDYFLDDRWLGARAAMPMWTTWDDHEMWNDYPERQFHMRFTRPGAQRQAFERCALGCLDLFQGCLNPSGGAPGRSFAAQVPPVSFFVADTRTRRKPHQGDATQMMEPAELQALCDWLGALGGPGVLVVGQPLWVVARNQIGGLVTADHNPPAFLNQYRRIVDALRTAAWDVIVVSGDVHFSRLLQIGVGGQSDNRFVYELVSSPVVHIPTVNSVLGLTAKKQGSGSISDPSRVPEWPAARARYLFGTDVPNTYALLHLAPLAMGAVRATVSFEDVAGAGAAPVVQQTPLGPRATGWGERREGNTFDLRMR